MTPAKRRPATPTSKDPTRTATKDGTELLGPGGEPLAQGAPTKVAGEDSAAPAETGPVAPDDRATAPSPRRPRGRYPLPVWPD